MKRPEQALQRSVVAHIRARRRDVLVFHVPNGGGRSKVEAAILKGLGVVAGVFDLVILTPGPVLFIELKAGKGRMTPHQRAFAARLAELNIPWACCNSLEAVERFMAEQGYPL